MDRAGRDHHRLAASKTASGTNGQATRIASSPVRLPPYLLRWVILEHAAELEKPFAVAGVAQAAADEERAHGSFRQEARGHIVREIAIAGDPVHLANFVGPNGVNFLSYKGRQREQIMHKAGAEQIILVALEFVIAVCAEAKRASQEKLQDSGTLCAKRRAAFGFRKERDGPGHWPEISQL